MLKIESPHNETFKKLLSLTESRGLKKEGLFLLSGEKLIAEFLRQPHLPVAHEVVTMGMAALTKDTAKMIEFSAGLFSELDVLGTHFNILVLEQPPIQTVDVKSCAPHGIEVVLPVGDPGNLGALLRSCEAFGVPKVILTKEAAHPFLPKAVKASAGSALRVPLARGPALAEFPENSIALDMDGTPIGQFTWPADGFLIVGEEGPGFSKPFKQRICIPTQAVQSLNVVVAASIALAQRAAGKQS